MQLTFQKEGKCAVGTVTCKWVTPELSCHFANLDLSHIHSLTILVMASPGKRELQLRNCPREVSLWACLWGIFLSDDWHGWAQPTVGHPGQVVLGCVRKQAEPATGSNPGSSTPPWLLPCVPDFLWWRMDYVGTHKPNKPFPAQVVLVTRYPDLGL